MPGSTDDRLSFSLEGVNVFMAQKMTPKGDFQYDLVVETRGRNGRLQINGGEVAGSIPILKNIANRNRLQTLKKAFTHLKKVVGTEDSRTPF